jgi:hypothetical protein
MTPERDTIFTDAKAAIRRMASEERGPEQMCAIEAQRYITMLRRARPDIIIEVRWCPAHKDVPGNEKPTSGRSLRQKSQMPIRWNGWRGSSANAPTTVSRTPQAGNL